MLKGKVNGPSSSHMCVGKGNVRSRGTYCCAQWCSNNFGKNPSLSLFRIPRDKSRAVQWLKNAGREDLLQQDVKLLNTKYLCSKHFSDEMFMNEIKNKLVWNAVPTIFPKPKISCVKTKKMNSASLHSHGEELQNNCPVTFDQHRKILPKPITCSSESFYNQTSTTEEQSQSKFDIKNVDPRTDNCLYPISATVTSSVTGIDFSLGNVNSDLKNKCTNMVEASLNPNSVTELLFIDSTCEDSNEKTYTCTSCGEMFLVKSSLILHQTTYHPENSINCDICGKFAYTSKSEFMEHECDNCTTLEKNE